MRIGIVYACAGFLSLVLINGIITFMLTPGQGAGHRKRVALASSTPPIAECGCPPGNLSDPGGDVRFVHRPTHRLGGGPAYRGTGERPVDHPSLLFAAGRFRVVFHGVAAGSAGSVLSRTSDIHPFLITYGWMLPVVFLAGVVAFVRAERSASP